MCEETKTFNKNILIAVDESENATRAVSYVAQLLGGAEGFKVAVLHVIPDPEEDFFPNREEKKEWLTKYAEKIDRILKEHREILIKGGFKAESVSTRSELRYCLSMAECILAERDKMQYDTIVVGRQGLSRKEQFLFGSISSKIVNHANNCAVWVIS
jgi:nucleotide-binding universal stress UspA family protein